MRIAGLGMLLSLGACAAAAGAQQGAVGETPALAPAAAAGQQAQVWTIAPKPFVLHRADGTTVTIKTIKPAKTSEVCYAMRDYQYGQDGGGTGLPRRTGYETCAPASRLKTESVLVFPGR